MDPNKESVMSAQPGRAATPEIKDSRKPWAVLYFNVRGEVMPGTDYRWTRWGAQRRAREMSAMIYGGRPLYTAKVVRND